MTAVLISSLLLRHTTASLITSRLSRCEQRVPVAPSVPSPRLSPEGVTHSFASLASQTACVFGAVVPFASLVTFDGVAHCFASFTSHDGVALTPLLLRRERRVPGAMTVPSPRSSHNGVAHCFDSPALQTTVPVAPSLWSLCSSRDGITHCFASFALQAARTCGAVDPFASLVI